MAAKSKLTPENVETFIEALKAGNYRKHAAALIGVDERTIKRWLADGTKPGARKPLKAFVDKVLEAEAIAITTQVENLTKAGGKEWRAALAFLKCKAPNEFGTKATQGATEDQRVKDQLDLLLECVEDVLGRDNAARVLDEIARRAGKRASGAPPGDAGGTSDNLH